MKELPRPSTAFALTGIGQLRREPLRDPEYLEWLRRLPCAVCGRRGVHAAHLRSGSRRYGKPESGIAKKPDDDWTTPLCADDHLNDDAAQHRGNELAFWERHGLDPFAIALALRRCFLMEDQAAALEILRCSKDTAQQNKRQREKDGRTKG